MKSQSTPSNHLAILTLLVTVGFASLKFVSCANFTVINQLEHGKPLLVECPPNPAVSIGKGSRNTWHLDNNPPTLACNFTSNGRKTEIDNVLGDKDLYYLALNDGIARGSQDVPNDGKSGDWRMAARWYDEDEFNKDPCKRDPISCER
ncbi:hypothetical protein DCAR_0414995 [Daucus carota subsp. sativus]|uniref:Uncharacterized protein n=1 Tax=Daucus carota subsp. sativus TaxID=79200 RepID=A0A165A4Y5_DAUCS|nr:hypothetical protein DCAR_0414995 [Daucus carota subsp. sativus]